MNGAATCRVDFQTRCETLAAIAPRMNVVLPILIFLLCASGCATYEPESLSPAQTATTFSARRLNDPGLKSFLEQNGKVANWPLPSWNLPTLTLAAFYFHPTLDTARARLNVSRAEEISSGARPNPTVGITPEYSLNPESGVSPWLAGFNFDIPIETAGKRGYRIARARQLSEAARLKIGSAAWQVRSHLRESLMAFAAVNARVELLQKQKAKQQEIVSLLEQQSKAGAISQFDLATARIALTKNEIELRHAQSQIAEKRAAVAEAIGLPAEALAEVRLVFDLSKNVSANFQAMEIRREALQSRTDILVALAEYAAAQTTLQLEIAKQYPDVHLGTGYQFDQGQNKWSLGLSMELPVLNRNEGGIAEAQARRAEAAAAFAELQAKIIGELDRALASFQSAGEQLHAIDELFTAQKKQRDALETQFKAGAIDRSDLAGADLELAAADLAKLEAQIKTQETFGALEDAVQRPMDEPQKTVFVPTLNQLAQSPERSEIKEPSEVKAPVKKRKEKRR